MAFKKQWGDEDKIDRQQELTEKIIRRLEEAEQCLEKGLKWERPFFKCNAWPINGHTGEKYHNTNAVALMAEEQSDPRWYTFMQIQEESKKLGKPLQVAKGSKAAYIMKVIPAYAKSESGEVLKDSEGKPIPVRDENGNPKIGFKWYPVFNGSQIIGLEPYMKPNQDVKPFETVEMLSAALQERTGLKVEHTGKTEAYYSPALHKIHMPRHEFFKTSELYADTFLHEAGHSSGPALGRKLENQFGSEAYAREELVAELASTFMSVELGIPHNPSSHENHAAYLKSWIGALKNDKTLITKASSQASKATEYLMGHYNAYKQDLEQKQSQGQKQESEAELMAKEIMANMTKKPEQSQTKKPTMSM